MDIPKRLISALKSGKVVLFLGSGANFNCKMSNGQTMPNGDKLCEMLSKKFTVRKASSLAETAELIEAAHSRAELNTYIVELFTGAIPSDGFKLIKKFKWSSIYTTNYDLLVENVYNSSDCIQKLKTFYTSNQQMDLGPFDVPLYKLHGCISRADTAEGRLVITLDDYTEFKKYRMRLFNRLADQLSDKPFLYLGYSRQDSDFRCILSEVHGEMNGDLPEGYALAPGKTEEDDMVWQKKGVTLIDMDVDEFLKAIELELADHCYSEPTTFKFPILKQYESININDLSEIMSYFTLPISEFGDRINPINFYKGSEAGWADMQYNVDAERDIYEEVMENLLEDAISIENQTTAYCILAEAGAGKSTLLRRMAYDLCQEYQQVVFWYKGERRINYEIIETIYKSTKSRLFIFVDRGSRFLGNLESIRRDCFAARIPITIFIADRTNEWQINSGNNFRYTERWIIGRLSDREIQGIVKKLEQFNCLGNLNDYTNAQRIEAFKGFSDRQLLIALREATEGKSFDELIVDEYESIPNEVARRAYLHICAMHAFGKGIRTTSLVRSLGIKFSEFNTFFPYLNGLVNQQDEVFVSRHAVIAKIVFFSIAEAARIDMLEQLIKNLDLGYTSDYQIFKNLVKNQELVSSLGGIDTRRRLYEILKYINPADAFIEQHEARMEIKSVNEGGSLDRAERLLKNALKRTENALSIRHTTGLLYNERASQTTGPEKRVYIAKAVQEFIELTKRDNGDEYAWVSLIESRIQLGSTYSDLEERLNEYTRAEADYQKSLEFCGITPYLLRAKGKLESALGHGEDARNFFKRAISETAPPANLFANYIKWELRHKNIQDAREASLKAISLYKTNSEICVLRAKSLILGPNYNFSEVAQLLNEVQRTGSGYFKMEAHFWHGVAQWEASKYPDAMKQFYQCREIALSLARGDVKHIRYISGMNEGSRNEYVGSIVERGPRSAWVICSPSGVRVYINQRSIVEDKESFKISIGFNRLGPVAISGPEGDEFIFDYVV